MERSILNSTKKVLGIAKDYTAFDTDIIMHINSVFAILQQMGVGPDEGFYIEDDSDDWEDYTDDDNGLNLVRSYMLLQVRMLFDPPTTSFMLDAMKKQIEQFEWRISTYREWSRNPVDPMSSTTGGESVGEDEEVEGYFGSLGGNWT